MFGYDLGLIAIMTAALITGGIVKGVVAIGLPIVTIAILLNFMPPTTVLAIVVLPIVITNLWQSARAGNLMEPVRRFWMMAACFVFFLFVGARLVVELDTRVLFGVLGPCVAIFSAPSLLRPRVPPLKPRTEKWAGPLAGILSGLLGGVSTIWGPPMMMYLMMLKLDKDTWVRTVGMVWFAGSVPLAIAYWQNGVLNPDNFWLSAYACVPSMIGIRVGEKLRDRINQEMFRKALLVILFIIGLNLIRRAVF